MSRESSNDSAKTMAQPGYPWWEPYVFTAGVLLAFVVVLIAFGHVATIPYIEPILFVLATTAAVIAAFRKSSTSPTVIDKALLVTFFSLASVGYISKAANLLGFGFAGLALVWLCLSIHAVVIRHARRKEQLAKLDRAVETLSRALPVEQKEAD